MLLTALPDANDAGVAASQLCRCAAAVLDEAGEIDNPLRSARSSMKLLISVGLVLAGGVFAGLTLALMGLDELHLRVLETSSDDSKERENAHKVLKLLSRGRHWVLVVLLLSNVIVNESLPIFLDSALGGGLIAVVVATVTIVIFGEIIPQSVCVRYGLTIGAKCVPFVYALMYLLAPIAWPIAKLLDWALGKSESHWYKKAELSSLLSFHCEGDEPLRDAEIKILTSVLELSNKSVEQIMTPIADVVSVSADTILDHDTVQKLYRSGYSRIPVHHPGRPLAFIGTLLVKQLSVYDPSEALPVSNFQLSISPEAHPTINCFEALDYCRTGRAHLVLLSRTPGVEGGVIGVITLEDILEEIISGEIIDETDQYEDNHSKRFARRQLDKAVMRGIVEYRLNRAQPTSRQPMSRSTTLLSSSERTPLLANQVGSPDAAAKLAVEDTSVASALVSSEPHQIV